MNKFLIFIIFACINLTVINSVQAGPGDFIEGQMKYKILENGKKDFTAKWDEGTEILTIRLGLVWDNYNSELHANGFDLNNTQGSRSVYPEDSEVCTFRKAYGSIPGVADLEHNEIFIEFHGSGCKEDIPAAYAIPAVAVHFYDVRSWNPTGEVTGVFRLQLWDSP